jgi:hypothetical protein
VHTFLFLRNIIKTTEQKKGNKITKTTKGEEKASVYRNLCKDNAVTRTEEEEKLP